MTNALIIIKDYITRLENHDWSYTFSDDHEMWKKGEESREKLKELQALIDQDYQIWNTIAPERWRDGKY